MVAQDTPVDIHTAAVQSFIPAVIRAQLPAIHPGALITILTQMGMRV